MDQESLFSGYDQITCSPPCGRAVPSEIRGFQIPWDYRDFLTRHNGAHLIYEFSSHQDLNITCHVVLFSLEEILNKAPYTDPFGGYLGSELSLFNVYQNTSAGKRTTPYDTPCHDVPGLYEAFYRDHLVIGYVWQFWEESNDQDHPIRAISLLGIDQDGHYFITNDEHIESHSLSAGSHEEKTYGYCWQGNEFLKLLEEAQNG